MYWGFMISYMLLLRFIKVKSVGAIIWPCRFPPIMLTIECKMVNKLWVCSQSLPNTCLFISVLRSTTDHTPFEYGWPNKKKKSFRHVYHRWCWVGNTTLKTKSGAWNVTSHSMRYVICVLGFTKRHNKLVSSLVRSVLCLARGHMALSWWGHMVALVRWGDMCWLG
jgi:hypothetical protein